MTGFASSEARRQFRRGSDTRSDTRNNPWI